ncbi:sensor histidine kinase [Rhizobium deserti]|nr:sensor histidine kinase [Rhizobium deserti]
MPQPYAILVEALAQIAASNDSDQINEIARNAARRILSARSISMIQAGGEAHMPVWSQSSDLLASNWLASPIKVAVDYLSVDTGDQAVDATVPESTVERCPKSVDQLLARIGGFSTDLGGYYEGRDTIVETIAAQTLASATTAAISRCVRLAALESARARLELERDDVRHRLKNVYASAIGLARLSLPEEQSKEFADRLRTLAEVHRLLDGEMDREFGVPLGEVLTAVLSPYQDATLPRVMVEGPDLEVSSNMAAALGLLANELATNALKYGSLSVSSGQILVQWTFGDGELGFSWREIGGPPVDCGATPNQGSKLMRMIIEGQLHGKMAQHLTPAGLLFSALMPIA